MLAVMCHLLYKGNARSAEIPTTGFINWKAIFPQFRAYLIKTPTVQSLGSHVRKATRKGKAVICNKLHFHILTNYLGKTDKIMTYLEKV